MAGWIGVDLDGTLAEYTSWQGIDHIGRPIKPMVQRIAEWLAEGREVRIFTARVSAPGLEGQWATSFIHLWLEQECGLPALPVTNIKDFHMIELWDDRAVQVIPNTGLRADGH